MCQGLIGSGPGCSAEQWVALSLVLLSCALFVVAGALRSYYKIRLCAEIFQHAEPLPTPADETETPPPLLCIDSPNAMRCCEGEYDFVMKHRCNQQPCWLKKDGSRLIISGSDGHWYIGRHRGSNSTDFTRVVRLICSQQPHNSVFPHKVAGGWTIKRNFHWRADPSIAVQAPVALFEEDSISVDPEILEIDLKDQWVSDCSTSFKCSTWSGNNAQIPQELDKPPGGGEAGMHAADISDLSTAASSNLVLSTQRTSFDKVETALTMSYQKAGLQYFAQSVAATPRKMQDCHVFAPGARPVGDTPDQRQLPPRLPPQALHVSVPTRQTACSGLYVLVSKEQPNGRALWRQKSPELVHWLFCSPSGRWCIGGADVQRECFSRGAGYVIQTLPSGPDVFPHDCETFWQLWDSDNKMFLEDTAVQVTPVDLTS